MTSKHALGHGRFEEIRDVVYVPPGLFDPARTSEIAEQINQVDQPEAGALTLTLTLTLTRTRRRAPTLTLTLTITLTLTLTLPRSTHCCAPRGASAC